MAGIAGFSFYEAEAPSTSSLPAGSLNGRSAQYNIAPGEEEDVETTPEPSPLRVAKGIAPPEATNEDFFFEIEMLSVEDAGLELGV